LQIKGVKMKNINNKENGGAVSRNGKKTTSGKRSRSGVSAASGSKRGTGSGRGEVAQTWSAGKSSSKGAHPQRIPTSSFPRVAEPETIQSIYRRIKTQAAEGMAIAVFRLLREYIEEGRIAPEEAAMRFTRVCDDVVRSTEAAKYVKDVVRALLACSFVHESVLNEFSNYSILNSDPFGRI
jgi:hypothetical protein